MAEERVAAIVGPTASGKTALSIAVARSIQAEIVSLDSMQIYRGMDIGTAKATKEEMSGIRHHLIDVKDPSEEVSVAEYRDLARAAISDIVSRGSVPLLVGGSGLYLRAVVDDLVFPPTSGEVRAELEARAGDEGPEALHRLLTAADPRAAAKIDPGNVRRTVRALEVIELTGRPFSSFGAAWDDYTSIYELRVAGLRLPRELLYERIERRVEGMMDAGLMAEVDALRGGLGRTASQALGYRQALEAGPDADRASVTAEIVRATKRFARRQESWFRADPRVRWFDATHPNVEEIAGFLAG